MRMRGTGHVARMWKKRKERDHKKDIDVGERIISERILDMME
jgi:hypothetical protein